MDDSRLVVFACRIYFQLQNSKMIRISVPNLLRLKCHLISQFGPPNALHAHHTETLSAAKTST